MSKRIKLGEMDVEVLLKDIKNVHLSVRPPNGTVRISAPRRMNMEAIRLFTLSKLSWIRKQQRKMQAQERETPREYVDRESHYLWGKRYLLQVVENDVKPEVRLNHADILLQVRPGADFAKRESVMNEWYRGQLKQAMRPLVSDWETKLGVRSTQVTVKRMKTRWGSCNPRSRRITLNLELAKKPRDCLKYVVVHELAHLIEPSHNHRFIAVLDHHLPQWKVYRDELNRLPIKHEDWGY